MKALRAGADVFYEKRLALHPEDIADLRRIKKEMGKTVCFHSSASFLSINVRAQS